MKMQASQIIPIGMLFVFIGIFIIIIGSLFAAKQGKSDTKVAIVGLLGPIPFGFGNDRNLFIAALAMAVVLVVISLIWFARLK